MAEHTNELNVVDAEPRTTDTSNVSGQEQAFNTNAILNNTLDGFANLGSKFNPFAQKLGKGLGQVRQYAQERLGTAENITELPQEYKDLEKRVDILRNTHINLLKVTRTYSNPSYDYPVQIQESLLGITSTVTNQLQHLTLSPAERAQFESQHEQEDQQSQHPKTLSHALARVAGEGAEKIGVEEAYGTALFKVATIADKVGDARLKMDETIVSKFNKPMQTTLNSTIDRALKARQNVQSVRLSLDACKARYRAARPEKSDAARLEVEQAEDQFVTAVEEATSMMKAVLEDPEPYRHLAELVAAQAAYFKEALELVSELVPELEEIHVTQESLHQGSHE
ncbi:hypothetical protein DFQ28_010648 [Apophysomyces sp. BC1034]|nr:hypothetical protein DFQ30_010232 [Apophysomyces sp. BC1015]KAG0170851.1 hypothetical protein DFQ29_009097 [Apophysomyces sp. BC1021]KAG0184725.1 hypothetical protein DFQ28_010648 [Apophysomyces sp. BC1034]